MVSKLRWIKNVLITVCVLAMLRIATMSRKSTRSSVSALPTLTKKHVSERQIRRQTLLRQQCQRYQLGNASDDFDLILSSHHVKLLYSDRYKFIVCEIPKCASSSIKKILLAIENLVNVTDARKVPSEIVHRVADSNLDLRLLRDPKEIYKKMKSYKRLLIVRNPLYRLLSAYRSKIEVEFPWSILYANISRKIHSKFSPIDPSNKLATFTEFLSFVAEAPKRDRHWEFYNNLCLPCRMHFDFIAHMETIGEDMDLFMKQVNIEHAAFPSNYQASRQTDLKKVARYMETVPDEIVEKVFRSYNIDFQLFGFRKPMTDVQ